MPNSTKRLVLFLTLLALHAPAADAMDVVGVWSCSSYKQIQNDVDQLNQLTGMPLSAIFDAALQKATNGAGLRGLDKTRRFAYLLGNNGKGVLYVPVTKESGALLRNLHRAGTAQAVSQLGDTMVMDVSGKQVHVMRKGNYLVVADSDELLRSAVADPTPHLRKLSSKHDFAFRLDIDKLSSPAVDGFTKGFSAGFAKGAMLDELGEIEDARKSANQTVAKIIEQTKTVIVAMNLDEQGNITLDLEIEGREGTSLRNASEWLHFRKRPTFRSRPQKDVLASGGVDFRITNPTIKESLIDAIKKSSEDDELSETQKRLTSTVLGQLQSGRVALEFAYTGGVKDASGVAAFTATPETLLQIGSLAAANTKDESAPEQFEVRGRKFQQANVNLGGVKTNGAKRDDGEESISYSIEKSNIIIATGPRQRQLLYTAMQPVTKESKRPAIEISVNPGAMRDSRSPNSPLNTMGAMMKGSNNNLSIYAWPTESGIRSKFEIEGGFISKIAFISMIGAAANGR